MKYLCLAYGAERDWKALTTSEQKSLLAQDKVIRRRRASMGAVQDAMTIVRAWDPVPLPAAETALGFGTRQAAHQQNRAQGTAPNWQGVDFQALLRTPR